MLVRKRLFACKQVIRFAHPSGRTPCVTSLRYVPTSRSKSPSANLGQAPFPKFRDEPFFCRYKIRDTSRRSSARLSDPSLGEVRIPEAHLEDQKQTTLHASGPALQNSLLATRTFWIACRQAPTGLFFAPTESVRYAVDHPASQSAMRSMAVTQRPQCCCRKARSSSPECAAAPSSAYWPSKSTNA